MPQDPTRTTVLRSRYDAALQRRFRMVQRALQQALDDGELFGLGSLLHVSSVEGALVALDLWLRRQVQFRVLEVENAEGLPILPEGTKWQLSFVEAAYIRGVLRAARAAAVISSAAIASTTTAPIHVFRIAQLFTRNLEALEGVTAAMAADMRTTLTTAILDGAGIEEVARRLDRRIEIVGRNRARMVARTELIHAHAEGTLDEFSRQGIGVVIPEVEFAHAGDIRVCVTCLELAATDRFGLGPGVFRVSQARGIIPVHVQ